MYLLLSLFISFTFQTAVNWLCCPQLTRLVEVLAEINTSVPVAADGSCGRFVCVANSMQHSLDFNQTFCPPAWKRPNTETAQLYCYTYHAFHTDKYKAGTLTLNDAGKRHGRQSGTSNDKNGAAT